MDAHRHNSKLWWLDAEVLSVVPGKECGGVALAAGVRAVSTTAHCKTNAEWYFSFVSIFSKSENPVRFLWLSKTRY